MVVRVEKTQNKLPDDSSSEESTRVMSEYNSDDFVELVNPVSDVNPAGDDSNSLSFKLDDKSSNLNYNKLDDESNSLAYKSDDESNNRGENESNNLGENESNNLGENESNNLGENESNSLGENESNSLGENESNDENILEFKEDEEEVKEEKESSDMSGGSNEIKKLNIDVNSFVTKLT